MCDERRAVHAVECYGQAPASVPRRYEEISLVFPNDRSTRHGLRGAMAATGSFRALHLVRPFLALLPEVTQVRTSHQLAPVAAAPSGARDAAPRPCWRQPQRSGAEQPRYARQLCPGLPAPPRLESRALSACSWRGRRGAARLAAWLCESLSCRAAGGAEGAFQGEGAVHRRGAVRLPCLLAVRTGPPGGPAPGSARPELTPGCRLPAPGCRCTASTPPRARTPSTGRASSWPATGALAWSWASPPSSLPASSCSSSRAPKS